MAVTPEVVTGVVPQGVTDVFLGYGLIGAVALILLAVVGFLFRTREQDRTRYEAKIQADLEKSQAVIQKLNEDRIAEMRTAMVTIGEAMQTVEAVNEKYQTVVDMITKRLPA